MNLREFKELIKTTKVINSGCCNFHDWNEYKKARQLVQYNNGIFIKRKESNYFGSKGARIYMFYLENSQLYAVKYVNLQSDFPHNYISRTHIQEWIDKSKNLLLKHKLEVILENK